MIMILLLATNENSAENWQWSKLKYQPLVWDGFSNAFYHSAYRYHGKVHLFRWIDLKSFCWSLLCMWELKFSRSLLGRQQFAVLSRAVILYEVCKKWANIINISKIPLAQTGALCFTRITFLLPNKYLSCIKRVKSEALSSPLVTKPMKSIFLRYTAQEMTYSDKDTIES